MSKHSAPPRVWRSVHSPTNPRRVARLVASILAILSGLALVVFPPLWEGELLGGDAPMMVVGGFVLSGGVVCAVSWWMRVLVVERIGLTLLVTGLAALMAVQLMIVVRVDGSPFRAAASGLLAMMCAYLVARWQDVFREEVLAQEAIDVHRRGRGE